MMRTPLYRSRFTRTSLIILFCIFYCNFSFKNFVSNVEKALKLSKYHQIRLSQRRFGTNNDRGTEISLADDDLKPKFGLKGLDDVDTSDISKTSSSRTSTSSSSSYNNRKIDSKPQQMQESSSSSNVFSSLKFEDLYVRSGGVSKAKTKGKTQLEDLNGVEPQTPFLFAIFPSVTSYLGFQVTVYMANHFAVEFIDSDIYPVQRLAVVGRNLVVGIAALGTAFCAVVAIGLLALGTAVTIGVVKGELDPKKKEDTNEFNKNDSTNSNR